MNEIFEIIKKCMGHGSIHRRVTITGQCYNNYDYKTMEYLTNKGIICLMMEAIKRRGNFIIIGSADKEMHKGMEATIYIEAGTIQNMKINKESEVKDERRII